MEPEITLILEIGLILTFGVLGSNGLKKLKFPEILGFILVGIIAGLILRPFGLFQDHYVSITNVIVAVALGFIGFHLGSEIDWNTLKTMSSKVIVIIVIEAFFTFFFVAFLVFLITQELYLALLFGALSSATAPAGTAAVFWEYDCKGPLTSTTMIILALDDIFAIVLTDFAIDYASIHLKGGKLDLFSLFVPMIVDIGFSIALGLIAGILFSFILNREEEHGEYVNLIIGAVLVCIGISGFLGISYILPTMVFGITIASLCKKPEIDPQKKAWISEIFGPSTEGVISIIDKELLEASEDETHQIFHEVYRIASPLVALFFVLIGLNLDISSLVQIGLLGFLYLIGRTVAKSVGAFIGTSIVKAEPTVRKYLGPCLYSQAGVALGLAVLISDKLASFGVPEMGFLILNTITATTIVFQIFGPLAIKWAVQRSGEARSC
ncbi:MAG: cation:proton antiporter [Candidatus Heimdallarchaeota archaeon]|nr:MAG: cation:proton antiporter [Candidatus Heimdallarchaeota archaeon]